MQADKSDLPDEITDNNYIAFKNQLKLISGSSTGILTRSSSAPECAGIIRIR
jgi:hypothetical protein